MHALWTGRFTDELARRAGWVRAEHGPYQCWSLPELATLAPWTLPWTEVRNNPELFTDPKLFKLSSRRTVVRTESAGRPLFVKRSLVLRQTERLRYSVVLPKEAKELLLALDWLAAGLHVPAPVFFAIGPDPARPCPARFYVTEPLPSGLREAKAHFAECGFADGAIERIAREAARLHALPALHSDFRADHIYLGPEELWYIDLDGSTRGRKPSRGDRTRAFLQFFQSLVPEGITEEVGSRFIAVYDPTNEFSFDGAALVREARSNWEQVRASRPPSRKR